MFEQARFDNYADLIRHIGPVTTSLPKSLRVAREGGLEVYYAPFDYCNQDARLVICGLTPGMQQAAIALNKARELLSQSERDVLYCVKAQASFAGAMRRNLVAMLDHIGVPRLLAISSSADLFANASHLVHYTSALRLPVFLSGENYRGTPSPLSHPILSKMIDTFLVEEGEAFGQDTLWLPLGGAATESLRYLVRRGVLSPDQLLDGLPHPSGANAERIAYFIDKKPAEKLSNKTNAASIEEARAGLMAKVARLSARFGGDAAVPQASPESRMRNEKGSSKKRFCRLSCNDEQGRGREPSNSAVSQISYRRDGLPMLGCNSALRLHPEVDTKTHIWLPVARDRTMFSSSTAQKYGGYQIGAKGEEVRVDDIFEALRELRTMKVARWRRPNTPTGKSGIVAAVGWILASIELVTGTHRC